NKWEAVSKLESLVGQIDSLKVKGLENSRAILESMVNEVKYYWPEETRLELARERAGRIGVDSQVLEELLNQAEGEALDFKREQYPFERATDEQKSELLKDVISFANGSRRTDAYILIGIEEKKGGRNQVVGITDHLDDASLQQFINSKTQRPVEFSYQTIS